MTEEGEIPNTPLDEQTLIVGSLLGSRYNQDFLIDVVVKPPHHIGG
jgi:hypothetical protein